VLRNSPAALSAVEVAESAALSRVTVRRYLEYLTSQGLVTLTMRHGTRGRPEHRYCWGGDKQPDLSVS
jgi:response regulator of citrate/malate metabolism